MTHRWTESEIELLTNNRFVVNSSYAFRGNITIQKESKGECTPIYYICDIESEAMDVDGDWGWCLSRHKGDTLQKTLDLIKS